MIETFFADGVFALRIAMGPGLTNFPLLPTARLLTLEPIMFVVVMAALYVFAPPCRT